MSLFELQEVVYGYESVPALEGVSLSIAPGERVALLGANGSGKSTLLRLINGLAFATSGAISFNGEILTEARFSDDRFANDFRRQVGLVFQNPDVQLFNPTVFDEIAFGPLQLGWPETRIRVEIDRAMEFMEIAPLRDRPPHRLSGGEKKRVALASVLVLDPQVLLLDEPTAALDPRSQSQILDLLTGWGRNGRTVITATHDLSLVADLADRAIVLDRGRIAADGPPGSILADQDLLTRCNLIHAHLHRHGKLVHSHPHSHLHGHN